MRAAVRPDPEAGSTAMAAAAPYPHRLQFLLCMLPLDRDQAERQGAQNRTERNHTCEDVHGPDPSDLLVPYI